MNVDLFQVAKDLTEAHRDRLLAGAPITVATLLMDVGRCECGGPLIRNEHTAVCVACGRGADGC